MRKKTRRGKKRKNGKRRCGPQMTEQRKMTIWGFMMMKAAPQSSPSPTPAPKWQGRVLK